MKMKLTKSPTHNHPDSIYNPIRNVRLPESIARIDAHFAINVLLNGPVGKLFIS